MGITLKSNWHRMTLVGKILIFVAGFGLGFGASTLRRQTPSTGNELKVEVNGKVKKGSDVNINIEDANKQKSEDEDNGRKKFLGIF